MRKFLGIGGFLAATLWAALATAACPTANPQTLEAYIYGCPTASAPYASSLFVPAVPNSTTAPTSSMLYIPANVLVTLNDTQTLTNKTFTSPTINGATLSGTIAGSFTFSGVPVFSGLSSGTCALGLALDSGNHLVTVSCSAGGGLSGMTAGQVPIAASASTVTSSLPLSGTSGATQVQSTTSATKTAGHQLIYDANGNSIDGGAPGSGGTVTSIATTAPITGGTITASGTIAITGPSNLTTFASNVLPKGATTSPFAASKITDTGSSTQINYNAAALQAPTASVNNVLQLGGATDGQPTAIDVDAFNNGTSSADAAMIMRCARGTQTSPAAAQSGDLCTGYSGWAYGGSGPGYQVIGRMRFIPAENQSSGHSGGSIQLAPSNLAAGSNSTTTVMPSGGVNVGTPTGADCGAGCLNAATDLRINNVSVAGGSTTVTLNPGLASTPTTYNPGTQTITNGTTLSLQLFYEAHSSSCTINSTCGATNDAGKLLTATAASLTFTTPSPAAAGTASYSFGYDGTHTYSLTTPSGVIYGPGVTSGATVSGLACQSAITPDGTNWQLSQFCPSVSGGGNMTGSGATTSGNLLQSNNTGGTLNTATDTGIATSNVKTLSGNQTTTGNNIHSGSETFATVIGTTETVTLTSNNYNAVAADCGKIKLLPTGTTPTVTLPNINQSCTITFETTATISYTFQAASGGSTQNSQSFTHTRGTAAGDTITVNIVTPSVSAAKWNLSGDVTS